MKNTEIEFILNSCLNDAMCKKSKIKGAPNSNKIAEFVIAWMKDKNLDLHDVSKRSELLIAFYKHLKGNYNLEKGNLIIDDFLKSN